MKTSLNTAVLIILASLAAWIFFYLTTGPLQAPETMVVVGLCALIVISVKWLWAKVRGSRKAKAP